MSSHVRTFTQTEVSTFIFITSREIGNTNNIISSHYIAASLRCYVNHFFVVVAVSYTYRVNSTYSPDTINHQYIDGVRQIPLMSWSL